jgi:hypothetical protein
MITHANDLLAQAPPADYPCPQGMVRVVKVASNNVQHGTLHEGAFPPCERVTIDLLIDGCPYRITVGSFVDGSGGRRGLHVASADPLIVQSTGIKAASVWPLRLKASAVRDTITDRLEYLQQRPDPTAKEILLHEMGTEYHTRCEAYDRTVCTLRTPRGTAMPANYQERRLIRENADRVRSMLIERLRLFPNLDIHTRDLDRAIGDAAPREEPR